MNYKSLTISIFQYFGYKLKTKYRNLGKFYYFFPLTFGDWKTPKSLDFLFCQFRISLFGEISPIKESLIKRSPYLKTKGFQREP